MVAEIPLLNSLHGSGHLNPLKLPIKTGSSPETMGRFSLFLVVSWGLGLGGEGEGAQISA